MVLSVLAVLGAASALAAASSPPKPKPRPVAKRAVVVKRRRAVRIVDARLVRRIRANVWRWQAVMGSARAHTRAALRTPQALRYWRRQALFIRRRAGHPPHRLGWLCIHRYEGSWHDSGDPYWGGLQMDRGFMETYAPRVLLRRGWADHWTSLEQMWVAERAHRSGRGYGAWPNTARLCGLL
jgi:CubicO group peptidase (beta-lactamase class C family)